MSILRSTALAIVMITPCLSAFGSSAEEFPALDCYKTVCSKEIASRNSLLNSANNMNLSKVAAENKEVATAIQIYNENIRSASERATLSLKKTFQKIGRSVPACASERIKKFRNQALSTCETALKHAVAFTSSDDDFSLFKSQAEEKAQRLKAIYQAGLSNDGIRKLDSANLKISYRQRPLSYWLKNDPNEYMKRLEQNEDYEEFAKKYVETDSTAQNIVCQGMIGNPFWQISVSCNTLEHYSTAPLDNVRYTYNPSGPIEMEISAFTIRKGIIGQMVFLHELTHVLNAAHGSMPDIDQDLVQRRRKCISKELNLGEISRFNDNPYIEETISDLYGRMAMTNVKDTNLQCELAASKADDLFSMLESKYAHQTGDFYSLYTTKRDDDPHLPSFLRMAIDNRMNGFISHAPACDRYLSEQHMDFKSNSIRECLK